eukprot:893189-Amphidinium_carterae.1
MVPQKVLCRDKAKHDQSPIVFVGKLRHRPSCGQWLCHVGVLPRKIILSSPFRAGLRLGMHFMLLYYAQHGLAPPGSTSHTQRSVLLPLVPHNYASP